MTAPPQGYQPQQQYPAPPIGQAPQYPAPPQALSRGPRRPRWTAGLFIGLLFLAAAAAAVWGTFEKIQTYKHVTPEQGAVPGREFSYSLTWWKVEGTNVANTDQYEPYGLLLAIGGGLLVIGAVLALTAIGGRRAGLVSAARVSAGIGIGVLAGAVAIRFMDGLQTIDQVNSEKPEQGESFDFDLGLGIYLPAGAVAAGLIGLGLTLIRGRAGRVEPDTPRMGFAMPYQAQQYQQPYQQQPYQAPTSQPIPVQQPTSQPVPVQQPASQPVPVQQPASQPTPVQQQPTSQPTPVHQQPASQPPPAPPSPPAPEQAAPPTQHMDPPKPPE